MVRHLRNLQEKALKDQQESGGRQDGDQREGKALDDEEEGPEGRDDKKGRDM